MKKYLLLIILVTSACQNACPKCIKGHDEMVMVPERYWTESFQIDDEMFIPIPRFEPAHLEKVFVCDQYELERE